jgi:hypothetical protein
VVTDPLRHAQFAPLVGTTFEFGVEPPGRAAMLTLTEVTSPTYAQALECFALRWTGPPGLPQRTYSVRHPLLGETLIFIVPVGQDGTAGRYEAAFSVTIVQA